MNDQFVDGMTVYDAAGEKIGTLRAVDTAAGYLDVRKGWLFPTNLSVPLSAVQRTDTDGLYLRLSKEDLQTNPPYVHPPHERLQPQAGPTLVVTDASAVSDDDTGDVSPLATGPANATVDTSRLSEGTDTTLATDQELRVPVHAEELVVETRPYQEIGHIHLHKDIVEEEQTVTLPVQRERVTVEHVAVAGTAAEGTADSLETAFQAQDIVVPVRGDAIIKQAHVTEEVRLHKEVVTQTQEVHDTVRKERVRVEADPDVVLREGGVAAAGAGPSGTADATTEPGTVVVDPAPGTMDPGRPSQ